MKINNPNKLQRIKGINKDKEFYSNSNNLETISDRFRGCIIDKFEINVVLENRSDFQKLAQLLQNIYPCLTK